MAEDDSKALLAIGMTFLGTVARTPRARLHFCREKDAAKRVCAVKVLTRAAIPNPARVMKERDAMQRLSHPCIAGILRTAKDDLRLFFVLEVLPGRWGPQLFLDCEEVCAHDASPTLLRPRVHLTELTHPDAGRKRRPVARTPPASAWRPSQR